ncbi:hypothetical protein L210DRAFT_107282 [Boletus edulis BED1]|uniref:Uncharacterized protein n=1 Tax=Boletus edulis BED1 TaxID=1328754 RepID=A0AAD4BNS8_BOLED|nr:hypothetical protein L210DRAFT_107282 [Boletus edulis BED1]
MKVAANTEIITFSSSREPTVDLPLDVLGNWSTLHPTDNEWRWLIEPAAFHTPLPRACSHPDDAHTPFSSTCPHALWLLLDLDDDKWASYATFTLRLSWAASTPVDFEIALYSPQEVLARHSDSEGAPPHAHASVPPRSTTRSRFARIYAVHAGVATPTLELEQAPSPRSPPPPSHVAHAVHATIPFIVILEPVYAGVLPATLLPTIGLLIPIVLVAVALVPWITASLEPCVQQAREELKAETFKRR